MALSPLKFTTSIPARIREHTQVHIVAISLHYLQDCMLAHFQDLIMKHIQMDTHPRFCGQD
jgi:hypothetical protein